MHSDPFGKEWCKGVQQEYHRGRRGTHRHLALVEWYRAYPPSEDKWGKYG